ncbi:uncharacterized protein LOC119167398 isoform X1 [Rhipicephalus microplus]|uniref:uncharacterized protein LOC119167398 isoform X1 n=1 Tax=Rhipicephalus microplus TaxID=6941 RepID=UPI0023767E45
MLGSFSSAFTLFLLLILAASSEDFQEKSRYPRYRIRKFLNTSEPIWTYNSTLPEALLCTVDVKLSINRLSTRFNRSYYIDGRVVSEVLQGWFRRWDKVIVGKVGKRSVIEEDLVYAGGNRTCGVFKSRLRLPGQHHWYDLRVKNSSILTGPTEDCVGNFSAVIAEATKKVPRTKSRPPSVASKPIYYPWRQTIFQSPSVYQQASVPQRPSGKEE